MRRSQFPRCFLLLIAGFEYGVEAGWKRVIVTTIAEGQPSVRSLTHLKNALYAAEHSVLLHSMYKGGAGAIILRGTSGRVPMTFS